MSDNDDLETLVESYMERGVEGVFSGSGGLFVRIRQESDAEAVLELGHVQTLSVDAISNPGTWVPKLVRLPGLTRFGVCDETVSGELLADLPLTTIEEVSLDWMHHQADEALLYVAQRSGIRTVSLDASLVSARGLANLANSDTIEKLYLRSFPISQEGWKYLGRMQSLRELAVWDSNGPDSFSVLSGLKNLESLDLYRSCIDPPMETMDWDSLRSLRNLKSLSLKDCQLNEDAPVPRLGALDQVRLMRLDRTGITPRGLERLRHLLPGCAFEYAERPDIVETEFFPHLSGRESSEEDDIRSEDVARCSIVLHAVLSAGTDEELPLELDDDEETAGTTEPRRSWWSWWKKS